MQTAIDTLKWLLLVAIIMVPIAIYPPLIIILIIAGGIFASHDRDTKIKQRLDTTSYTKPQSITIDPIQTLSVDPVLIAFEKKAYIASPEWNTKRLAVLKRDSYSCQRCGAYGVPLEVHHLHYRTFKTENLSDLVSLCRDCHQAIHDKYGYDYNDEFPIQG